MARLEAGDLHAAVDWPAVLAGMGIDETYLRNRHGPCPICGGKDRFRFDDKDGRGTWICAQCGAGDGFQLLRKLHGWTFPQTLEAVAGYAGLSGSPLPKPARVPSRPSQEPAVARYTARVRDLHRTTTLPELVPDCVTYLQSRNLWPLPEGCALRAHAAVDYFRKVGDGKAVELVGRYPALFAGVRDVEGKPVTAHVTYLENGAKLTSEAPRKILSPVKGRIGCAVRLFPLDGEVLGVGEGLETCISAHLENDRIPVWACLNTALLAKFVPPPGVHHVVIFVDRDFAGMEAAWKLREELDGRCTVELRKPPHGNDWNDARIARA